MRLRKTTSDAVDPERFMRDQSELADDVEERIGFYHDKLKDFEFGREPELASGVLVFDAIAKAVDVLAPHIATIAALARLKFSGLRPIPP
jgi:hypothetical protein